MSAPKRYTGSGVYGFIAEIDGDDVVVRSARATQWGDPTDPDDPGTTATGFSTAGHPDFIGCSLPMDIGPSCPHTQGSPLRRFPWGIDQHGNRLPGGTMVEVENIDNGHVFTMPLIDIGPAAPPLAHAQIDLTAAAFLALGVDWRKGEMNVNYRILGGRKFMPDQNTSPAVTPAPKPAPVKPAPTAPATKAPETFKAVVSQPDWHDNLTAKHLGSRLLPVRGVVLHDTSGSGTHNDTLYLANPQDGRVVSVDFTVERDGSIWKLNPQLLEHCTWHCGRATHWRDMFNQTVSRHCIGIEICKHDPDNGPSAYTDVQVKAVAHLCAWLVFRFNLTTQDITSHRAIITDGSRVDPYAFPWDNFWDYYWDYLGGRQPHIDS